MISKKTHSKLTATLTKTTTATRTLTTTLRQIAFGSLLFVLASSCLWTEMATAQALTMPKFRQGLWTIYNEYQYYATNENFGNANGTISDLPNEVNDFKIHENVIQVNYGVLKELRLSGLMRLAHGTSNTAGIERSRGTLTDIGIGADYQAIEGRFSLYPGLEITMPLATVEQNTDEAIISEGAWVFKAKSYADYKLNFLDIYGELSASLLTDGRGGRIGFLTGVKKTFGNFLANLEVSMFDTIIDDEFTDQASQRTDITDRVNGSSLAYYSINPGKWTFNAQGRYKVHRSTILGLGLSKDFYGSRSSSGFGVHVFAEIRLGQVFPALRRKRPRKTPSEDFVEESAEDPNLKYFKKDPTKPRKNRKKKRKKSSSSDETI